MKYSRGEGISEAIGFILILAAIVIAFSLYIVYMIPAMGRENEVLRMSEVKDRLTEYKVNIDTLWTGRQCSTAYGPSIILGADEPGGLLSMIPFLHPIRAGAALALNQRFENITITQDSYFRVDSGGYNETGSIGTTSTNVNMNMPPENLFINISSADLLIERGIQVQSQTWSAWVNITPYYDYSVRFSITTDSDGHMTSNRSWIQYTWNRTDVTVRTFRGGSPVVSELTVYKNIRQSTVYPVDLASPVYGISAEIAATPQTISLLKSDSTVMGTYHIFYGYITAVYSTETPMGSLEFRSNNNYYIPQTYYYQMGGVFLEQDDGATMEIPPSIAISRVSPSPVVKIGQIVLLGNVMNADMAGSGPITVGTVVTDIVDTPLPAGNNTRWVNLSIEAASSNAAQMWGRTFREIADRAGLPVTSYTNGTAGNVAFMNITGNPANYDIQLSLTRVNVSGDYVEEYSSGGIERSWRSISGFRITPVPTTTTATPTTTTPAPTPTPLPGGSSPWYNCAWTKRKNITIDATKVAGDLTNFPVLVKLDDPASGLNGKAQADGDDILFTASDGSTKLSHEIESYSAGNLVAWVKVPSLPSTQNTTIYMYYGNSAAPNQEDETNVWDTGYKGVWHLNEASSTMRYDSTSNNNDLSDVNTVARSGSGQMAGAASFTRSFSERLTISDAAQTGLDITGSLTVEAWFTTDLTGSGPYTLIEKHRGSCGNQPPYLFRLTDGGVGFEREVLLATDVCNGGGTDITGATNSISATTWYHLVGVYNGTYLALFKNGAKTVTQAYSSGIFNSDGYFSIGGRDGLQYFDGLIDEARVSAAERSFEWIRTEYNNQKTPATFHYLGPEESGSCSPAFVQSEDNLGTSGITATVTLPAASTSGNLMVVSFVAEPQGMTISSVTDSRGNTYIPAVGPTSIETWGNLYTYYASNIAGGATPTTITVTFNGGSPYWVIYAAEYSGIATSGPLDQTAANNGNGIPVSSGSKTTTQASELIFGFAASDVTVTEDPSFTWRSHLEGFFIADRFVSSTGSYAVTGTNSQPDHWACQMATFKGAS